MGTEFRHWRYYAAHVTPSTASCTTGGDTAAAARVAARAAFAALKEARRTLEAAPLLPLLRVWATTTTTAASAAAAAAPRAARTSRVETRRARRDGVLAAAFVELGLGNPPVVSVGERVQCVWSCLPKLSIPSRVW